MRKSRGKNQKPGPINNNGFFFLRESLLGRQRIREFDKVG